MTPTSSPVRAHTYMINAILTYVFTVSSTYCTTRSHLTAFSARMHLVPASSATALSVACIYRAAIPGH